LCHIENAKRFDKNAKRVPAPKNPLASARFKTMLSSINLPVRRPSGIRETQQRIFALRSPESRHEAE
jgi:hypothetical protein